MKLTIVLAAALLCACSTQPAREASTSGGASPPVTAPAAAPTPTPTTAGAGANTPRIVKSRDGRYTGELVGTPRPDSRLAKLQIGMGQSEVQDVMGRAPDRFHSYESGKRWIPFYFGNDARRMQVLYRGEGCLIFTGGNIWGGAGGDLIQIAHDASGACYQP